MTDRVQIKDLFLRTIIGINEEERRNRQDVLINIILYADTRAAGASDDISDAVNYIPPHCGPAGRFGTATASP
jgi:FolB domain-containing protein